MKYKIIKYSVQIMGFRSILPVFMLMVLLLMFYIFIEDNKDSRQSSERALHRAISNLQLLQDQNSALISLVAETENKLNGCEAETKKLKSYLMKATSNFERVSAKSKENIPSMDEEIARREVERSTLEFLRYTVTKLQNILKISSDIVQITEIKRLMIDSLGFQKTFKNNMYKLTNTANGHEEWRRKESEKLGNLVQRRLEYLQYPKDCENVKRLTCKIQNECGFGCQLHEVAYCLIMAYATRRTLVFKSEGWWYARKGWTTMFLPLGKNCSIAQSSNVTWKDDPEVEKVPVVELSELGLKNKPPRYAPLAVPGDLVEKILHFHGNPAVWWIGQIVKFALRPNPKLNEYINTRKKKLDFKNPIVGVQIRRTDKVNAEAQFHSLEEYMGHVNEWFELYERRKPLIKRKVYLATDDANVFVEASKKYPHYIFIGDKNASLLAELRTRYSEESLRGVILDINMLSLCDFLVCTFSSQVCRAAYELMQTRHGDASLRFKSLDDVFYFGGQREHRLRMTEDHKGREKEQKFDQNNIGLPEFGDDSLYPIRRNKRRLGQPRIHKGDIGVSQSVRKPGAQNIGSSNIAQSDMRNIDEQIFNQLVFIQQRFKQKTFGMIELEANKDDEIAIQGNLWNGYSIGKNVKSRKTGYFPSYKAIDIILKVNMPTYTEVPDP